MRHERLHKVANTVAELVVILSEVTTKVQTYNSYNYLLHKLSDKDLSKVLLKEFLLKMGPFLHSHLLLIPVSTTEVVGIAHIVCEDVSAHCRPPNRDHKIRILYKGIVRAIDQSIPSEVGSLVSQFEMPAGWRSSSGLLISGLVYFS